MTGPSLADLDAFVAVARARGFRGAAQARGASASGLSEAVRRLEAALGVRLLNRTTRSVTPTEAGERLLERLKPALGENRKRPRRGEQLPLEPARDAQA
jgi:DNA-binding transcriptional LysR family regulator